MQTYEIFLIVALSLLLFGALTALILAVIFVMIPPELMDPQSARPDQDEAYDHLGVEGGVRPTYLELWERRHVAARRFRAETESKDVKTPP